MPIIFHNIYINRKPYYLLEGIEPINRYLLQRDFLGLALAGPFYTFSFEPGLRS